MKIVAAILLLIAFLSPMSAAQNADKNERSFPVPLRPISVPQATAEKLLLHRVEPVWKHHDMEARVFGTVVLKITISKSGSVECARVISGPAMLQQAALDAVRQWKYKPYIVNRKQVVFSTRVSLTMSND